jgi:hypothetical protein
LQRRTKQLEAVPEQQTSASERGATGRPPAERRRGLFIRTGTRIEPLIGGGGQEQETRAGTENVPYIVGLGAAAKIASADLSAAAQARLVRLRDALERELRALLPGGCT